MIRLDCARVIRVAPWSHCIPIDSPEDDGVVGITNRNCFMPSDDFEQIVSQHYEPLYRFALSLTRTEADARDLTQQTFYTWATKGHQLRDISKVKTWLFTTLHRAFLKSLQKQTRFAHDELESIAEQLTADCPEATYREDCSEVLSALARVDRVYQGAVAL